MLYPTRRTAFSRWVSKRPSQRLFTACLQVVRHSFFPRHCRSHLWILPKRACKTRNSYVSTQRAKSVRIFGWHSFPSSKTRRTLVYSCCCVTSFGSDGGLAHRLNRNEVAIRKTKVLHKTSSPHRTRPSCLPPPNITSSTSRLSSARRALPSRISMAHSIRQRAANKWISSDVAARTYSL